MEDNRKISLCIPVYNRFELLLESFDKVKDDPRISEICIYSDGSNTDYVDKIVPKLEGNKKVTFYHSFKNQGVHIAKKKAVELATNEFIILFDSDNVINIDYIDRLYQIPEWNPIIAYQPSYLAPHFDFRDKAGWNITKGNLQDVLNRPNNKVDTWGNAQNFFIHRENYLNTWEEGENVNGNDSLWFFYLWMKAGYSMQLVPNLSYFHRIHDKNTKEQAGNYNSDRNAGQKIEQVMKLLKELK